MSKVDPIDPMDEEEPSFEAQVIDFSRAAKVTAIQDLEANPEEAVRVRKVAEAVGRPPEVVAVDLKTYETDLKTGIVDDLLSNNPYLQEYINNVALASKISVDDYPALDSAMRALSKRYEQPTFFDAFHRGLINLRGLQSSHAEAFGEAIHSDLVAKFGREGRIRSAREAADLPKGVDFWEMIEGGDYSQVGQWLKELVGEQGAMYLPILTGATFGAALGSMAGPLAPVTAPVGATIGAVIGAVVPSLIMGVGEVQQKIKEIDPDAVKPGWAYLGGSAIAALDMIVPGKVGSKIVKAFGHDTAEAIAKHILEKPLKQNLKYIGKETGEAMLIEGVTEGFQEAIGTFAAAGATDTAVDLKQLGKDVVESFVSGAVMGGAIGGATGVATRPRAKSEFQKIKEIGEAYGRDGLQVPYGVHPFYDELIKEQTKADAEIFDEALSDSLQAATRERAPDMFAQYLRMRGNDKIGIRPEAVEALYGDKVPTPDDGLLGWVQDLPEQLDRAKETGSDVQIPVADFLARVDKEVYKKLQEDIRYRSGGITQREAVELKPKTDMEEIALEVADDPVQRTVNLIRRQAGLQAVKKMDVEDLNLRRNDKFGAEIQEFYKSEEPMYDFDLVDEFGDSRGYVTISERDGGKRLYIEDISAHNRGKGSNAFGPTLVRRLLNQLKEQFPQAEELEGLRVSGARGKDFQERGSQRTASDLVRIKLHPAEIDAFVAQQFSPILPAKAEIMPKRKVMLGNSELQPLFGFTAKDLLDTISEDHLQGIPKILHGYFKGILANRHGDTPIYIVRDADLQRAWMSEPSVRKPSDGVAGYHDPEYGHIVFSDFVFAGENSPDYVTRYAMHEIAHAFTWMAIENDKAIKGKIQLLLNETKAFIERYAPDAYGSFEYAFTDVDEFMSEAMSQRHLQEAMAAIPISKDLANKLGLGKGPKNLWDLFREFLKDIFEKLYGARPSNTVLDGVLKVIESIDQLNEIEAARQENGMIRAAPKDLVGGPAPGLTKDNYERILKHIERRWVEDMEASIKRAEKEQRRRQTREWEENLEVERRDAIVDIYSRPVIRADRYFRDGVMPDGQKVSVVRIAADALTEEQKAQLPKIYYAKKGIHPDDLANFFGFQTGQQMIDALTGLEKAKNDSGLRPIEFIRKLVADEAERRMVAKYGDIEGNIRQEAYDQALSENEIGMAHEVTMLHALQANAPTTDKAAMVEQAEKNFEKLSWDAVSVDEYLNAAGRADRMRFEAALKEDWDEAYRQSQYKFFALIYARLAKDFVKRQDKDRKLAKKYAKRDVKGVDLEVTERIQLLMLQAGLKVAKTENEILNAIDVNYGSRNLTDFVKHLQFMGTIPAVSDALQNGQIPDFSVEGSGAPTVADYNDFWDAIQSLDHIGRNFNKVVVNERKQELNDVVSRIVDQLKKRKLRKGSNNLLYLLESTWTRPEEIIKAIDYREELGPMYEAVAVPMMQSKAKELELRESLSKYLTRTRKQFTNEWRKSLKEALPNDFIVDSLGDQYKLYNMTREHLINIMLHWGSRSNIDKLVRSLATAARRDGKVASRAEMDVFEARLKAYIDKHATEKDWEFVKIMWQPFKEWQPEIDKVMRNVSGVAVKFIEPTPFDTPFGRIEGGYWPITHDKRRSNIIDDTGEGVDLSDKGTFGGAYFWPKVPQGNLKQRTGYVGFVDIDSGIAGAMNVMQQTMHFIAYHDALSQATRIIYNRRFGNAFRNYYGLEYDSNLKSWLRRVAMDGNADDPALKGLQKVFGWARVNLIRYALPLNIPVTLGVDPGLPSWKNWAGYVSNWDANSKFAEENSSEIKHLIYNMDRDYRKHMDDMVKNRGVGDYVAKAADTGFYLISFLTQGFRKATFIHKYNEGISKGMTHAEACHYGDMAVRERHGGATMADLPAIMSSNEYLKSLTLFYGYFNTMQNWLRGIPDDFRRGDYKKAMAKAMGAYIIPTFISSVLFTDWDEDEDFFHYMGKVLLLQAFGGLPVLRNAAAFMFEGFPDRTPFESIAVNTRRAAKDLAALIEGAEPKKPIQSIAAAVGPVTGAPILGPGRMAQFLTDVAQDKQEPEGFWDWYNGLLYNNMKRSNLLREGYKSLTE